MPQRGSCPAPSWRPSRPAVSPRSGSRHPQSLAPQNVQVEVEDLLTGVGTVVDPNRIAALPHPELLRHHTRDLEQPPHDRRRQLCDLLQRGDVLLGDDEHVHRRPPPDVLEYQHLVLVVHNLGLDLPTHYLTEYALGLAQQPSTPPYDVLVRLSSSARARATATIPAVSLRSRYGPSRARASPASRASRTSPSLHPPSGPTKRLAGSPEALCSRTPPSPTRRTASRKSTGSSTAGTHSLSDWRAAASATRRQRPNFPSRGLTTPRSVKSGTMLVTPTSVAFSTTRSMRPPFGTA